MAFLERFILLQVIDSKWKEHLYSLDNLREGIHLRAYGQRDPLVEYKREAFQLFDEVIENIKNDTIEFLFKVAAVREEKMTGAFQRTPQQFLHPEAEKIPRAQETGEEFIPLPGEGPGGVAVGRGASSPPPSSRPSQVLGQTIRRDQPKVGRNEPCPCGSGKKYKKCHGA